MTAYDYVVVGAGVAGSTVAARLSRRPGTTVLLLEAGERLAEGPPARDPARAHELWGTDADWGDDTVPQTGLGGRTLRWPAGRALGGSSAINAALWVRGNPADFDAWAPYGGPGWDRGTALAAFRRLERNDRAPAAWAGADGPLPVESFAANPWTAALTAAAGDLGFTPTDANGPRQYGVDTLQLTATAGRRVTFADAFLPGPDSVADGLRIVTGAQVTGLVIEDGRAVGVTYRHDGGPAQQALAAREVLLAAGAVRSAQLLLLSGVGPADDLAALGVTPVVDLPGVGRGLQDHVVIGGAVPAPSPAPPLPAVGGAVAVFARADGQPGVPDLEVLLAPGTPGPDGTLTPGVRFGVVALQPRSRGTVRLAGPDPSAPPLIDPGHLTDPGDADLGTLLAGWDLVRRLLAAPSAAPVAAAPPEPLDAAQVRALAGPMFHPVGTARFGPDGDPGAVLDGELRVRGIRGLRVVDAAAAPLLTRGHTMGLTAVIADRAADLLGAPPQAGAARLGEAPAPAHGPLTGA